jgi:hypothetical protein
MWPLSTAARIALTQSHGMTARATIYNPLAGVLPDLPIAGGQVDADATSQVRRSATLLVDPHYWPASPTDLLAPFGSEATIDYGIVLADGNIEWVPLGRFSLDDTSRTRPPSGSAEITVKLVDRSARVAEDRLDAPTQTVSGATVVAEIRRLIQDTLGVAVDVIDNTGSTQIAPVTEIDRDRWADGVEVLADAIGAEVFFDRLGSGVIRPQPTLADTPVWLVTVGEDSMLLTAKDRLTRDGVYNRVIAAGQRTDGSTPVFALVSDTDPLSPTYYGGPFGKKSRYFSSSLLTTVPQCTTAATALLNRATGLGVQIEMEQLVNPALEPGDVIGVLQDDGTVTTHIVDKVPIPLTPDGTQALGTRSNDLPPEQ